MTLYLKRHPFISKDLLLMVRTLAPTENGLPVQIYCFSSNKNWPSYESIQAEIMEHFVSVLPEFGLYPFQNPTARDYVISWFDRVWQGPFYCRRNSLAFGLAKGRKGIVRDLNIY